jgi:hypothetical protein
MRPALITTLLIVLGIFNLSAQNQQHFQQAFDEISAMLEGKQPLDFERAVFLTENAYRDNEILYNDFKATLDIHAAIIEEIIIANDKHDWKQFVRGSMGSQEMEAQAKEFYQQALTNYSIYTYLTDTIKLQVNGLEVEKLPFQYSTNDPFGFQDWKNSQVLGLLETQQGNCYALATLFKIFSERLNSGAAIVTAPQHIYIQHRDPTGKTFNVEVATRSFPDMGSIQTLTYTTREALLNDISMRKLDLKQSVGLCLVYLAKGFENKNKTKADEFVLACANKALHYDPKNLNAILLKAQVYEQRVMLGEMESAPYEEILAGLYNLGYRQMPDDMKQIILAKIQGIPSNVTPTDKTPNPFEEIGEHARYVTLSNGLFEEVHKPQKLIRYGQTIFDTEKGKVVQFLDADSSSYQIDPVVFALSVDPLTSEFPWNSPYAFAENDVIRSIDLEGAERLIANTIKSQKFLNDYLELMKKDAVLYDLGVKDFVSEKDKNFYIYVIFRNSGWSPGADGDTHTGERLVGYAKGYQYLISLKTKLEKLGKSLDEYQTDDINKFKLMFDDLGLTPSEVIERSKKGIKQHVVVADDDYTLAHELILHESDQLDGKEDTSMSQEHIEGHGKEYYKTNSTTYSPARDKVDPKSKMGRIYDRMDKARKKKN